MIYFATAREIGRVKIGYTASIKRRLFSLQTASPVLIVIEKLIEGDLKAEKVLHEKFKNYKVNAREWFLLSEEIEEFMDATPDWYIPDNDVIAEKGQLTKSACFEAFGDAKLISELLGISIPTIYEWPEIIPEPRASQVRWAIRAKAAQLVEMVK